MITMVRDRLQYGDNAARRLHALRMVQTTAVARRLARVLFLGLIGVIAAMTFLPWQQSAKGTGRVVAFVPQERQQTVESPTKGVLARIADGLIEGARVKRDQFILEIQPQAANLVEQLDAQLADFREKITTSEIKAEAYQQNVEQFSDALEFAVSSAESMVDAAQAKLLAKMDLLSGYDAKVTQSQLNYDRQKRLHEQGVKATKELEKARKDYDVARADLASIRRDIQTLTEEVEAKKKDVHEKRSVAQTKIDYARAMQQDALGQIATVRKEMRDLEIKRAETDRLIVRAPRDGTIYRMPMFERGQTIKAGDPLFTIVPESVQPAVELWVTGNDTPLIRPGDHVRLQFEGWPALQFVGWPSVAVGTFGGQVVSVDAADNGKGEFRVLARPGKDSNWPKEPYLRQGVRANGWVMLRRVSLGYEIWRQLNGFPPVIDKPFSGDDDSSKDGKDKKPKLPK